MSLSEIVEDIFRPLKPDLYIGCRYQFDCLSGKELCQVTGFISNLRLKHKGRWHFSVTAVGFTGAEVTRLVRRPDQTWYILVKSGDTFTQLIEGNFQLIK